MKLIETLLWDGTGFPRRAGHLARLQRSAGLLGWDAGAAERALARVRHEGPARVRLTLDAAGRVEVVLADLPPALPVWRVGLAEVRLWSADPWLTVKSTHRQVYDVARAGLAAGLDEVIFANERGEVCEGTITSVFFDRGAGMRTPPLACGALPGVLRAELACPEEVLHVADLPGVRLWLGNALRGLGPAVWVG